MKRLKIVVIGAGSASFGREIITDIMVEEKLRDLPLNLTLVDIDRKALKRMKDFALILKENYQLHNIIIEATIDRREALPGAQYVIVSVAQKRWDMWEKDFYIPLSFGFHHVYGENGGPGAAFHTLRSLHLMMPICHDIEQLCPDAWLFNYTNPESRICLAAHQLTHIRTVGLCHGPMATWKKVSEILEKPREDIDVTVAGINHFHWVLEVKDHEGRDLMPEFTHRMQEYGHNLDIFTRTMYDLYGYLTYPAPSHPEEYVHFAYALTGPVFFNWGIGKVAKRLDATVEDLEFTIEGRPNQPSYELWCAEQVRILEEITKGEIPIPEDFKEPSEELAIPIICDIEYNTHQKELAANVPNHGQAILNLPEDAIVEVPVTVDAEGVHPVKVGPLPEAISAMCRLQISIQNLLVEAYRQKSKKLLLQALLLEPTVDDVERAKEMMEVMLRVQAGYLLELS